MDHRVLQKLSMITHAECHHKRVITNEMVLQGPFQQAHEHGRTSSVHCLYNNCWYWSVLQDTDGPMALRLLLEFLWRDLHCKLKCLQHVPWIQLLFTPRFSPASNGVSFVLNIEAS